MPGRPIVPGRRNMPVEGPRHDPVKGLALNPSNEGLKASLTNADRHRPVAWKGSLVATPCCLLPHRGRLTDSMARVHHGQALGGLHRHGLPSQRHITALLLPMERKSEEGKGKEDKKDKGH
uniref:Uncharacterized protein n=1 Tax=Oryza sativa subsp. japonica TaxID=39947 RepID=Q5Z415_ORYSJ|nr:hypothetical protein [Oryza sativa Japonica Group]BAD62485.1 hypothetical protein [Oryza sativa Japonica Group]